MDLLKIDVEGHFMEVLHGMDDADYPKIRNIVMECDWMAAIVISISDTEAFLQDRGYHIVRDDPTKENDVILYGSRVGLT